MLFIITAIDGPDGMALRAQHRPDHLKYLQDAGDRVKLAGPLLTSGDDPQPRGSVIVIDAASEGAVKLFADNDPYRRAGVFASVDIQPFRPVLGQWRDMADA